MNRSVRYGSRWTRLHVLVATILVASSIAPVQADTIGYGVGTLTGGGLPNTNDVLLRFDLATGNTTPIGQIVDSVDNSTVYQSVGGLDFDPVSGKLYGVADVDDLLLEIDPATGIATNLGQLTRNGGQPIPSIAIFALNFDSTGTLYFTASSGRRLSIVDIATTDLTDIATGGSAPNVSGLASDSADNFFGVQRGGDSLLLSIDPTDGSSTAVGEGTGIEATRLGLDFDAGDTLWAVDFGFSVTPSQLYNIDTSTGIAQAVAQLTVPETGRIVQNVESLTIIPLPAAAWLFASALEFLAWTRRRSVS